MTTEFSEQNFSRTNHNGGGGRGKIDFGLEIAFDSILDLISYINAPVSKNRQKKDSKSVHKRWQRLLFLIIKVFFHNRFFPIFQLYHSIYGIFIYLVALPIKRMLFSCSVGDFCYLLVLVVHLHFDLGSKVQKKQCNGFLESLTIQLYMCTLILWRSG